MSKDNEVYPRSVADSIVDVFEDVLDKNHIYIPDNTRKGNDDESCLYGDTYFDVLDKVETIVFQALERASDPETVIVPFLYVESK